MAGRKKELQIYFWQQFKLIKEAALRDEDKWYDEMVFLSEARYLFDWISNRYDHFESMYGEKNKTVFNIV